MLPLAELKTLIARLDPGSLTALAGSLLSAERARLGMAPNALVMSDDLNEADGGLDGLIDGVPPQAPDGGAPNLPTGLVGLQLKAVRRKQPSALKLGEEIGKPGPTRVLNAGGTYVLVWSQDLNPAQRQAVENVLQEEAAKVVENPTVAVWDAATLAGLCQQYPAAATDNGLVELGAALSLPELLTSSTLKADQRPWQSDPARDERIERLRERAARSRDPIIMQVLGDPGTGKTRLVAEALDTDELRDNVLYVNGPEGLGALLTHLIRRSTSTGIVFVDEIDEHDVASAASKIGGLEGRWRLVTVTSRGRRRWQPEGSRDMVLEPLSAEATTKLVVEHSGLSDSAARRVAEVAAGFPELAFRLADELRANPALDLITLSRLRHPQEILHRALADEDTRRHLAPLALFSSVGFDDDLRYQLEAVAGAFSLAVDALQHFADQELGRFVSRAGRYRLVSPRLVAIWLASDLIETTPGIADMVFGLPEPIRDAFVEQLDLFGPDVPHLPAALTSVLEDERFRSPDSFDEAAGRLLRASAAIIPAQVADTILDLLTSATEEQLRSLPRRDLVWALEVLLWWPETWQRAIEAMYLLAQAESETYGNNASAQFAQFFSVLLSGTTVPFQQRARWLEEQVGTAEPSQIPLLMRAARASLKTHHSRGVTGFRGGGEPDDWRPQTGAELLEARRAGWDLLLQLLDRVDGDGRSEIVDALAEAIRAAYRSGNGPHVEETLLARHWETPERARLTAAFRKLLVYETDLPDDLRARARSTHDRLLGTELEDRASTILAANAWDLRTTDSDAGETPELLRDLASEVMAQPDPLGTALALGGERPDRETRYQFLRSLVGAHLGADAVGTAALAADPIDKTALAAALSLADTQDRSDWATAALSELLGRAPDLLPELLRFVNLTAPRIELVLNAVDNGEAQPEDLAALLYGAPVAAVDERHALRIVQAVAKSGRFEEALGIFEQWLEKNESRSEDVKALANELSLAAVRAGGGTMVEYYLRQLLDADAVSGADLLELWRERMINIAGLPEELDQVLTERVLQHSPEAATKAILDLVRMQASGEGTYGLHAAGDLALLSRAARAWSVDAVWAYVEALTTEELQWSAHHMDWSGPAPDPLVRRLLSSERLVEVADEASSCFFNALGAVMGSMARAFEGELHRARAWEEELAGTPGAEWARRQSKDYASMIETERQREAERNRRFL